jgi:hypothetical protein
MKLNITGVALGLMILLAGWCFGDRIGLGVGALIVAFIQVM